MSVDGLPQRRDITVDAGCADRLATAAARYRFGRPTFWVVIVVELVLAALLFANGHGVGGVILVGLALILPAALWLQTRTLARILRARDYAPGQTLGVDWQPSEFTVTAPYGQVTRRYAEVAHVSAYARAVAIKLRGSRMLVILPRELVPDPALPALRGRGRPSR